MHYYGGISGISGVSPLIGKNCSHDFARNMLPSKALAGCLQLPAMSVATPDTCVRIFLKCAEENISAKIKRMSLVQCGLSLGQVPFRRNENLIHFADFNTVTYISVNKSLDQAIFWSILKLVYLCLYHVYQRNNLTLGQAVAWTELY